MIDWIEKHPIIAGTIFFTGVILMVGSAWVTSSHFEARAYEHTTGHKVSTWDAMFIELRVQGDPR